MTIIPTRLRGHFQTYVARYAVLATAVLTPLAGILGSLAADIGADTPIGHALLATASALGAAAASVVFIKNLGVWQMLDTFGVAGEPRIGTGEDSPEALARATEELAALPAVENPGEDEGDAHGANYGETDA